MECALRKTIQMNQNLTIYNLAILIFSICTLTITFYSSFFGINFTDEPFHMMYYMDLAQTDVIRFVYPYTGKFWHFFFPDTLISFRILGYIVKVLCCILPIWYFFKDTMSKMEGVFWASVSLFLTVRLQNHGFNQYNSSLFVQVIILLLMHRWINTKKYTPLVLVGILSAVNTGLRLPEFLTVIPLSAFIYFIGTDDNLPKKKLFGSIGLLIGSFGLGYVALLLAHFGFQKMFDSGGIAPFFFTAVKNQQGMNDSYETDKLLKLYAKDVIKTMLLTLFCLGNILIYIKFKKKSSKFKLLQAIPLLLFSSTVGLASVLRTNGVLNLSYCAFWISVMCMILYHWKVFPGRNILWLLLILSFACIHPLGSNTGLWKMGAVLLPFLPVLLLNLKNQIQTEVFQFAKPIALAILSGILIAQFGWGSAYEDAPFSSLTATVAHPKLVGLKTSKHRKKSIEYNLSVIDSIQQANPKSKVLFYGRSAWLYYYLTDTSLPSRVSFRMPTDNPKHTQIVKSWLHKSEENPPILILLRDKKVRSLKSVLPTRMEQTLDSIQYAPVYHKNNVTVYQFRSL